MQTTIAPRFNQLIELYYQPLFRFAAALCGSPEPALALTQRTFRVARERDAAAPANIKQWLFTILFREFLERRSRVKKCQATRRICLIVSPPKPA